MRLNVTQYLYTLGPMNRLRTTMPQSQNCTLEVGDEAMEEKPPMMSDRSNLECCANVFWCLVVWPASLLVRCAETFVP